MTGHLVFRIEGNDGQVAVAAEDISRESYTRAEGSIRYTVVAVPPGGEPWSVSVPVGFSPGLIRFSEGRLREAAQAESLQELARRPRPHAIDLVKLDWDDPDFVIALAGYREDAASLVVAPVFWNPGDVRYGHPGRFGLQTTRQQLGDAAGQIDAFLAVLSESIDFGQTF